MMLENLSTQLFTYLPQGTGRWAGAGAGAGAGQGRARGTDQGKGGVRGGGRQQGKGQADGYSAQQTAPVDHQLCAAMQLSRCVQCPAALAEAGGERSRWRLAVTVTVTHSPLMVGSASGSCQRSLQQPQRRFWALLQACQRGPSTR